VNNSVWIALLVVAAMPTARAATDTYVGIVEDFIPYEHEDDPAHRSTHLRLAFIKDSSGWKPINGSLYPSVRMAWHVAFDGRDLGTIQTQTPEGGIPAYGDRRGTLSIVTPVEDVPRVKRDERRIPTYVGTLQSQPLLAVSRPNTSDPDQWKPTQLTASERRRVLRKFRPVVPKMRLCDGAENQIALVKYKDREVEIIHAYRAKDGRVIAGAQLPDRTGCQMYEDSVFYSYWYVLETDGTIRLFGDEMTPIDAADLDGDGESEWVFKGWKGCATGYRLYSSRFREINSW
jgi:hypothetical protein